MSIDLDSKEGRKHYLSEKLDDLLEGINDSYGTLFMDELLLRLEMTVKDFYDEIKNLCDELVNKEKERQQLLEMIKNTDDFKKTAKATTQSTESDVEKAYRAGINANKGWMTGAEAEGLSHQTLLAKKYKEELRTNHVLYIPFADVCFTIIYE